jgi:hypothetical protein
MRKKLFWGILVLFLFCGCRRQDSPSGFPSLTTQASVSDAAQTSAPNVGQTSVPDTAQTTTPNVGQTAYYKYTAVVNKDGKRSAGDKSGQFIRFTEISCYDSDKEGLGIGNGYLLYIRLDNDIHIYYGDSFLGGKDGYYYFTKDFKHLNIATSDGVTYVYEKAAPPAGAVTSAKVYKKPEPAADPAGPLWDWDPGVSLWDPIGPAGPVGPVRLDQPSSPSSKITCNSCKGTKNCNNCRGTGNCTSCNGTRVMKSTAYYTDGHTIISDCGVCRGTGNCNVCHGSGKCYGCSGRGYY